MRPQRQLLDLARHRGMHGCTDERLALADLLSGLHEVALLDGCLAGRADVLAEQD